MSRNSGKDTSPELYLNRLLEATGWSFTRHPKTLPGKPDLVSSGITLHFHNNYCEGLRMAIKSGEHVVILHGVDDIGDGQICRVLSFDETDAPYDYDSQQLVAVLCWTGYIAWTEQSNLLPIEVTADIEQLFQLGFERSGSLEFSSNDLALIFAHHGPTELDPQRNTRCVCTLLPHSVWPIARAQS